MARRSLLIALLSTVVAACGSGKQAPTAASGADPRESAAPAAASAAAPAALPATTVADGSPQIALAPDGVHIEYHVYGRGEPAIVLIHGWATDANYWNAQVDALKGLYTVVTVDLAGHGASGKNRTDWSMGTYGEDVATVVRQLPSSRVILVGHSMGATVALEATRRIGDRVVGIIAVDALRSIGLPPLSKSQIEAQVAPFRADFIGQTRKLVAESLFRKDANPLFVQKVAYDMSLEPPEVGVPALQALLSVDFATLLPDIHVPVLAINSDLAPTDEARIRKSVPAFKAVVLDHTDHFLMMEVPQRFNPLLLRDIDSLRARSRG
ncbi:MAG TPA: alpha/beta hydrolase [Steroidobacteraceae bacterium]|nr:alpha/beta hydrolase [Steroidobacteraceae bacterium]